MNTTLTTPKTLGVEQDAHDTFSLLRDHNVRSTFFLFFFFFPILFLLFPPHVAHFNVNLCVCVFSSDRKSVV